MMMMLMMLTLLMLPMLLTLLMLAKHYCKPAMRRPSPFPRIEQ